MDELCISKSRFFVSTFNADSIELSWPQVLWNHASLTLISQHGEPWQFLDCVYIHFNSFRSSAVRMQDSLPAADGDSPCFSPLSEVIFNLTVSPRAVTAVHCVQVRTNHWLGFTCKMIQPTSWTACQRCQYRRAPDKPRLTKLCTRFSIPRTLGF